MQIPRCVYVHVAKGPNGVPVMKSGWHVILVGVVSSAIAFTCGSVARAQGLPATGQVNTYRGVNIDTGQCVPAGRNLAKSLLHRDLPFLGASGVAAEFWDLARAGKLPGFAPIANDGKKLPPASGCMIIWSRSYPNSGGAGHIAFNIGTVNPSTRTVRVADCNGLGDHKGRIHDVSLNGYVLGWLVPN